MISAFMGKRDGQKNQRLKSNLSQISTPAEILIDRLPGMNVKTPPEIIIKRP
jgi:hypothetical protein